MRWSRRSPSPERERSGKLWMDPGGVLFPSGWCSSHYTRYACMIFKWKPEMADRDIFAFTAGERADGVCPPDRTPARKRAAAAALALGGVMIGALAFRANDILLPTPPGDGWVDAVAIDPVSRRFEIRGWAASSRPDVGLAAVTIFAGDEEIYDGPVEPSERPDVALVMKRPEWLRSGWRATAWLPDSLPAGRHPLRVMAQFDDGDEFPLAISQAAREILAPESGTPALQEP